MNGGFAFNWPRWGLLATVAVLIISAFLNWQDGTLYQRMETDTQMRLHRVENLHQNFDLNDHSLARSNSPYGTTLHWSRFLEALILLPALALAFFLPFKTALLAVAAMFNPIVCGLALLGMLRILAELGKMPQSRVFVLLSPFAIPLFALAYRPGVIDYHSLLAACLIWQLAFACRLSTGNLRKIGWIGGIGIALTPEYMLSMGVMIGWLVWQWLQSGNIRPWRTATLHCLLVVTAALLLNIPPESYFTPVHDTVSIVHASLLGLTLLATFALQTGRLANWRVRFVAGSVAGAALLAAMYWLFPDFWKGPFSSVSPEMKEIFLQHIYEMKSPLENLNLFSMAAWLVGLAALPYLVQQCRANNPNRAVYQLITLLLVLFACLLISKARWHYYFSSLSVLALALWLDGLLARHSGWEKRQMVLVVVAFLAVPFAFTALAAGQQSEVKASAELECDRALLSHVYANRLPDVKDGQPMTIAAPANYGSDILFHTPHYVLSGNYHRNTEGYLALHHLLHAENVPAAREIAEERGIDLLLYCAVTDKKRPFLDALENGAIPDWLEPITDVEGYDKGVRMYRTQWQ